jgi:hypothetical protein
MPLEIQMIYHGDGKLTAASRVDLALLSEHFGQGEVIVVSPAKRRSKKQHGWFFDMISRAYDNQRAGPSFDDSEGLRKWLLVQAGHCTTMKFEPRAITKPVVDWLKTVDPNIFFSHDSRWIYARTAKSIAFKAVGSAEMTEIANKVVDVIMEHVVPGTARSDWEPFVLIGAEKAERKSKRIRSGDGYDHRLSE